MLMEGCRQRLVLGWSVSCLSSASSFSALSCVLQQQGWFLTILALKYSEGSASPTQLEHC